VLTTKTFHNMPPGVKRAFSATSIQKIVASFRCRLTFILKKYS
jgi:hypothetical protein